VLDDVMATGLNRALGFSLDEATADRVVMSWTIDAQHLQPYGIVHGGVYCSVVEASASVGAALWYGERGKVVGVSNHTATPIHRGRSQQLWLVEVHDAEERLVARGQVRLQNLAVD
jgi:1,4-dihydroxy-2-naphthoyl-CoA hydrolase